MEMVFHTDVDEVIVGRIVFVKMPSCHESVGSGKRQTGKPFPLRITGDTKPVALSFWRKVVHLLNATSNHNIGLARFDRHPSISKRVS